MKPFSHLVRLSLEWLSGLKVDLLSTMEGSGGTPEKISMSQIVLDVNSWRGTLMCMRDYCHRLEHLRLRSLFAQQSDNSYLPLVLDEQVQHSQGPTSAPDDDVDHYFSRYEEGSIDEHFVAVDVVAAVDRRLQSLCPADRCYDYLKVALEGGDVTESHDDWYRSNICGGCGKYHGVGN